MIPFASFFSATQFRITVQPPKSTSGGIGTIVTRILNGLSNAIGMGSGTGFPDVGFFEVSVDREKLVTEHPLENGYVASDHTVIRPRVITVEAMMHKNQYQEVCKAYDNRTILFNIKARGDMVPNCVLAKVSVKYNHENMTHYMVSMVFRENVVAPPPSRKLANGQVLNPSDVSTMSIGEVTGRLTEMADYAVSNTVKKAKSIFGGLF